MKQTQAVEEIDEDTLKVTTTTFYTKEEYRRTFAPALALELVYGQKLINEKVITADYCIEDENHD